jgi:hypothetical protein
MIPFSMEARLAHKREETISSKSSRATKETLSSVEEDSLRVRIRMTKILHQHQTTSSDK